MLRRNWLLYDAIEGWITLVKVVVVVVIIIIRRRRIMQLRNRRRYWELKIKKRWKREFIT